MSQRLTIRVTFVMVVALATLTPGWAVDTQPQTDESVAEIAGNVTDVADIANDVVEESADCDVAVELNFTPSVAPDTSSTEDSMMAAGCRHCSKDRTWCKCTYNGLPRVSCDPCCYGNLGIPQVCLD